MEVIDLAIPEVKLIKPPRFNDGRGFFQQTYHYAQYAEAGIPTRFVQDNWSRSTRGVLRGLHYQHDHPQAKLVNVIRGEIFDVAVDMRRNSPTLGKWVGEVLSADNGLQMFIPQGFAHGFLVLSDIADFVYKCSDFYTPDDECGVIWNDSELGISWPSIGELIVSDKDAILSSFSDAKLFHN